MATEIFYLASSKSKSVIMKPSIVTWTWINKSEAGMFNRVCKRQLSVTISHWNNNDFAHVGIEFHNIDGIPLLKHCRMHTYVQLIFEFSAIIIQMLYW